MAKVEPGNAKAIANPTKAFFVRMITRDISLEDCILDLIDNSIDSAWRSEGSKPMGLAGNVDLSKYTIEIAVKPDGFSIEDNCGGMSFDDAVNHAFSFGRQALDQPDDYSIGVYGIGMKRAVFKLGGNIRVSSTFVEKSGRRVSFVVPIDVQKWLGDDAPPWDFDIDTDEPLKENGVRIAVNDLTPEAARSFDNPAFLQNLRRTIGRDYSLHLRRGLHIVLNGNVVPGWQIELRESEEFAPVRFEYKEQVDGTEVDVEIIGGMAAPPPESLEPDEKDDGDSRFGWYVVCNGRIVLAADKTSVSGWGTDDWPQWHRQYSGFIGIVIFSAANAIALPLTTTKRSVDVSSEIFRWARQRMREVTRSWIDYTNQRKQAPEDAKRKETAARAVPIHEIRRSDAVKLPTLVARPPEPLANVNYSVARSRMRKLAKEFGSLNMPYRDVGIKSFDYAYSELVGDA